ncbi:hypothetical protein SESBI_24730 [Sesbania bispinosa]|nr:hypothetical protein SESBI_24730 [Sesbania bispinosa]
MPNCSIVASLIPPPLTAYWVLMMTLQGTTSSKDVHFVPNSPVLETTSSFRSISSSSSLAKLPPIRVHVEDGMGGSGGVRVQQDQKMLGIEEQFAQIGVGQKQ